MTTKNATNWWMWYWPHENYVGYSLKRGESVIWTCNEKTVPRDFALVYVKRPTSAIVALMRVTSERWFDREAREFTTHLYSCDAKVVCVFDRPATIKELRADSWLEEHWGLLRGNFQPPGGKPPIVADEILNRLARHIAELNRFI